MLFLNLASYLFDKYQKTGKIKNQLKENNTCEYFHIDIPANIYWERKLLEKLL